MFVPVAIVTDDGAYILLKFVESLGPVEYDEAQCVVDKLKGDVRLSVRTISGQNYIISMQHQMKMFKTHNPPVDEQEYCDCIIKKWIDLGNPP